MATHPNMIFDAFLKTAAQAAASPDRASGSAGMGDTMQRFKSDRGRLPQWSAPNPTQGTPSDNPIAAQKIAPPPPVQ